MLLENSWLVVSLVLTHAENCFCYLVWSELASNRWWSVICLIQLPLVPWFSVPWPLRNRPLRLILCFAGVGTLLRMISSRPNDFWSRIQQNQRIKSFDCSSCIQTELRHIGNFRLQIWKILRSRSHFIFFFTWRKLNKQKNTLESPPNLVFPIFNLLALSASLISN